MCWILKPPLDAFLLLVFLFFSLPSLFPFFLFPFFLPLFFFQAGSHVAPAGLKLSKYSKKMALTFWSSCLLLPGHCDDKPVPQPGSTAFIKTGWLTWGNKLLTSYVSITAEKHLQGPCALNVNRNGLREWVTGWLLRLGIFSVHKWSSLLIYCLLWAVCTQACAGWKASWRSSDNGAAHLLLVAPEVVWGVNSCYSERVPRDSTHR